MEAAETILDALQKNDFSDSVLSGFQHRIDNSWIKTELYKVRNFHQAFDKGLVSGMVNAGLGLITGGRGWGISNRLSSKHGHEHLHPLSVGSHANRASIKYEKLNYDGKYLFDKVTNIYHSATAHDEDQVPHLRVQDIDICINKCTKEFGNPCQYFCPADVYEMTDEEADSRRLQINFSNCVHCKTCDIMDPYQIIDWSPPEGGDGPAWVNL